MSKTVLGVTNLDFRSHDNAACLIADDRLMAQAEEERFTRQKRAYDTPPVESIRFCLDSAGITAAEIDAVAVGWDLPHAHFDALKTPVDCSRERILKILFPNDFASLISRPPELHFVPHHQAHAASAYYASCFHDAAILVIDGAGETDATSLWNAKNGSMQQIETLNQMPHSLGFMFEGFCEYLGFKGADAGKVMGLAAYCSDNVEPLPNVSFEKGYVIDFPADLYEEVERDFAARENYWIMDKITALWGRYCERLFGSRDQMQSLSNEQVHPIKAMIAARLQKTMEMALLSMARELKERTGHEKLCLSGGAALNCSANGVLERSGIYDDVFIYPAAGDSGVALGAALDIYYKKFREKPLKNRDNLARSAYFGPEFSDQELSDFLRNAGVEFNECADDFSDVADKIAKGEIIAWFQGRLEIGPRALGARSILADPRRMENLDKVNRIKSRESWRPLAPSVLHGHESSFFTPSPYSPFMLKAVQVIAEHRHRIPAVVHVDGSSRYQSVSQNTNPRYHALIEAFYKMTGVPLLLNTSFNHSEPIVCTPEDALKTFKERDLDALVLGKFIINK